MGNQFSTKVGYVELRDSIPGSMVADQDFELFYSLCKVETVRTISTLLCPSSSQLFYVVVAGEVNAQLSCPEIKQQKPAVATNFRVGETIHFFNASLRTANATGFDFGECLRNGDIKLALHFKTTNKVAAKVIGMDRRAFDVFSVKAKCNLHALTTFLNLNVTEIAARSPFFKTITPEQAAMLGPLLKVRLSHSGKVISPFTTEMATVSAQTGRMGSPKAKREVIPGNYTPAGPIAMLLSGTALSVPYGANLAPIIQRLSSPSSGGASSGSLLKSPLIPSLQRQKTSPKNAPLPIHYPQLSEQLAAQQPDPDSDRSRTHLTMHPGILLGLSDYYCKFPRVILRTYIASSPSVFGYLDVSTLDALFTVDPRFSRVIRRNYYMLIMAWLKPTVALLRDMDEWSFALLSCKVFIKCFLADSSIYQKGETSDYAYIILGGSVKEVTESSSMKASPSTVTTSIERVLNWGTLFGEVALATNSPYFNTTTAREPTMLLAISKKVLDQIYNNNKAKLCEIRIKLLGMEVGLQHVIDHPRGSELFQTFLAKQHAAENLQFYVAVDRFDAMCKDVRKQYTQIIKLREETLPGMQESSNASVGGNSIMDDNTIVSYNTYLTAAQVMKADQQLTSREESDVNVTATTSITASATTTTTVAAATSYAGCSVTTDNTATDKVMTSTTATDVPSRNSSFAYEESQKSAGSESNKSMFNYYHHGHSHGISFGITSKPGSMDIGLMNEGGEDQSTRSSQHDSNKSSQYSHRSDASVISDTFFNAVEAGEGYEGGGSELHSRNLSLHAHNHSPSGTHGMWGKPLMKKPALESIISESNFSHIDDDDGEDGPKKFSVKQKPQSISVYSAVSNKIALIEEENENECDEMDEASPTRRSPAAATSGPPSVSSHHQVPQSPSTLTAQNLKLAIQTAVSIAENSPSKLAQVAVIAEEPYEQEQPKTVEHSTSAVPRPSLQSIPPSSDKTLVTGATVSAQFTGTGTPVANYTATTAGATSVEPSPLPGNVALSSRVSSSNRNASIDMGTPDSRKNPSYVFDSMKMPPDMQGITVASGGAQSSRGSNHGERKHMDAAQKINRQLHKVQKNIVELKEVARTIMTTYIYNGTELQLNLPGAMRLRTEERFEAWSTLIIANVAAEITRQDSFNLDPVEREQDGVAPRPSPLPKQGGISTKMNSTISSVSNYSMGESSRSVSVNVTRLGAIGESSKAFSTSAAFISSFQHSEQDVSGTSGTSTHIAGSGSNSSYIPASSGSASSRIASNASVTVPAPIRIPDFAGNLVPVESSTSTTPGNTHGAHLRSISVDPQNISIDRIDMSFVDLFKETKNEILKLLRDDKFPRWKATQDFQAFIASVKPYEKEGDSGQGGGGENREKSSDKDSRSVETPINYIGSKEV